MSGGFGDTPENLVGTPDVVTGDTSKWRIEKCRRTRKRWHVTGPNVSVDPDFSLAEEHEFRTGAAAIAFVAERLGEQ